MAHSSIVRRVLCAENSATWGRDSPASLPQPWTPKWRWQAAVCRAYCSTRTSIGGSGRRFAGSYCGDAQINPASGLCVPTWNRQRWSASGTTTTTQVLGMLKVRTLRSVRRTRLRTRVCSRAVFKMEFKLIATSRGFPCIVLGAYKYRKIRETAGGEIVWRCTKKSCLGQVRTNLEQSEILDVKDDHDHVGLDPLKLHRIKHQQPGRTALPLPRVPATHRGSRSPRFGRLGRARYGVGRVEVLHQALRNARKMQPVWARHVVPRNDKFTSAYRPPFWVETAAKSIWANLQRLHQT